MIKNKRRLAFLVSVLTSLAPEALAIEASDRKLPVAHLEELKSETVTDQEIGDKECVLKLQGAKLQVVELQEDDEVRQERIVANIGTGIQSRLQIIGHQINEIIGQGLQYKIHSDKSGNHVFITPTDQDAKKIEITIIYDEDKACDLTLLVKGDLSQSIVIKPNYTPSLAKYAASMAETTEQKQKREQEGQLLLNAMRKNRASKYDAEITSELLPALVQSSVLANLVLVIDRKYGWAKEELKGLRLSIKNAGKSWVFLEPDDLKQWFQGVELVHLTKQGLKPSESIMAYVIRRDHRFRQNGERE